MLILSILVGKGKVLLVISKMLKKNEDSPRLFGVDYSENLINIAEKNLACINASKG